MEVLSTLVTVSKSKLIYSLFSVSYILYTLFDLIILSPLVRRSAEALFHDILADSVNYLIILSGI